jgi:hypothetical protein
MIFPYDSERDPDLRLIWQEVEETLSEAEKVVFIGYSLPEYDPWAVNVFRAQIGGEVEVYNPSDQDRKKYRDLFGARIVREDVTFASSPYASGRAT